MVDLGREPILIIGGGIGGLSCALALRQAGYDARIFERAPQLNEVGAGITLWHNALSVLERLGVGQTVRALGQASQGGVIGRADGRVLVQMGKGDVGGVVEDLVALHRADLQRALYEAQPEGAVTLGAELESFEEDEGGVVARFSGGLTVRGSLLIGADGVGSRVRKAVLSDAPPRYAGYTCWRGIAPIPEGWTSPPGEIWGLGDRFGVVGIGGGRLYWFAVATSPQGIPSPASERKALLLKRFGGYAFQIPLIIEATPEEAIIHGDIIDHPPSTGWSRGRAVLLGDAAHATTPNMGQGAAMAIESAMILARSLMASADLSTALRVYEHTRRPRAHMVTSTSWTVGRMAHLTNPALCWLRDALFRYLPNSVRARQLEAVASYDAASAPLDGAPQLTGP